MDYCKSRQDYISKPISGDALLIRDNQCWNKDGESVIIFSKRFIQIIEKELQNGYHLIDAQVNFVIYWHKEDEQEEFKIVLPEVYFERKWN